MPLLPRLRAVRCLHSFLPFFITRLSLVVTNCGLSSRELVFHLSHAVDFKATGFVRRVPSKIEIRVNSFICSRLLGPLSTDGMRSMWEFVFVSQFLRVFNGKFGFVSFTAEVRINFGVVTKNTSRSWRSALNLPNYKKSWDKTSNFERAFCVICPFRRQFKKVAHLLHLT